MTQDPQLRQREIILLKHLAKCKIPLTNDDWAGVFKELDRKHVREFYLDWIGQEEKQFNRLTKSGLFQERIKSSLILALYQLFTLRPKGEFYDKEFVNWWANKILHDENQSENWRQQEAKQKRDRKPKMLDVPKNWLEPMPIFNEAEPYGYAQATGQRRKVIENFLHHIKAKPTTTLAKGGRGKPKHLYGLETNCRMLAQWFGVWCDQRPEQKHDLILKEALLLAEVVAKSEISVDEKRLARLRRIFITHARSAGKKADTDSSFGFLTSASACREKFPPPVPVSAEASDYAAYFFACYRNKNPI